MYGFQVDYEPRTKLETSQDTLNLIFIKYL